MSTFQRNLIDLVPALRAYAMLLSATRAEADDLVQDTLEKAWRARDRYQADSNMRAWVFTILRNTRSNRIRQSRRQVEDIEGRHAARLRVEPVQAWRAEFADVLQAIQQLDEPSQEALLLVTLGLSYEEASQVSDSPARTVQSRVRRARARLAEILEPMD